MQIVKQANFSYDKTSFSHVQMQLNYLLYYSTRGFFNFFNHELIMDYDKAVEKILNTLVQPRFESRDYGIICEEKTEEFSLNDAIQKSSSCLIDELKKIEVHYKSYPNVKAFFLSLTNSEQQCLSREDFKIYQDNIKKLIDVFSDVKQVKTLLLEQRPEIEPNTFLNNHFVDFVNIDNINLKDKFYLVSFLYMKDAVKKGRCVDINELEIDYYEYIDVNNYTDSNENRTFDVVLYLKGEKRQNIPLYLKEVDGEQGLYSEASDKLIFDSKEKAIAFLQKMQAGNLDYLSVI